MQHSDFENATAGTTESGLQEISADPTEARIITALKQGDYEAAGSLLRDALEHAPDNKQLLRLAARQRRQAERFARVYSLLKETREAMEGDEFVRAVGAFREAANLSLGFTDLEQATFQVGVEEARQLGDRNWRIARTLLDTAAGLNLKLLVPEECWRGVKAAEREETIANVLAETALAKPAELGRARERLLKTLEQYPEDSGLANRLKSIESTIEDKRKWDERQKCLKKLIELRDAMQREEDPAGAAKYIPQSEALAAQYSFEPEFSSVLEDIKHQVISSERAATALKQDRLEDCLEECAWVLSRMRHHQLFLNLKRQAEEREVSLADEYSEAVSRIKELLAAGHLAEAESLCAKASENLPQFMDLRELKQAIEERRSKEERQLEANRQKRAQSKDEAFRWSSLDKIGALDARAEAAKKREEFEAVRAEAERSNFASAGQADVREAASALFSKLDGKTAALDSKEARRPAIYRALAIAATLLLGVGLAYWINNNHPASPVPAKARAVESAAVTKPVQPEPAPVAPPAVPKTGSLVIRSEVPGVQVAVGGKQYTVSNEPLKVELNADSYQVRGSRSGYKDFGPVTVAVGKAAETVLNVKLIPKPASLEIRGAEPGTQIKLDGVLLRRAAVRKALTKQLPAGEHSIQLSRNGFLPKTLTRNLTPGEKLVLTRRELQLESADARTLAAVKHPPAARTPVSAEKVQELQWQAVDKSNPEALRAFVGQYPNSVWANQAKQQMDTVLLARETKTEDADWSGVDHGNHAALEDFMRKHPGGRHAGAAAIALADVDRKARVAEAQRAEEAAWKKVNSHDEASLESYLRETPAGRYRNQAEADLAAIRVGRSSANETAAVLTVIARLANAWNAKDLDSILAIQRNLNKRVVKAELSHVRELDMQISPASPPQIDGAQAVVLCRRQASQVFSDGTRKQIPEAIVSYVLAKHDGNWTIEGTR